MYWNHLVNDYHYPTEPSYLHDIGNTVPCNYSTDLIRNVIMPTNFPNDEGSAAADVSYSQLQPTAKEFTPSYSRNVESATSSKSERTTVNLGAVRKDPTTKNRYWNSNRNKYNKKKYGGSTEENGRVDSESWGPERNQKHRLNYSTSRVYDDYHKNNSGAGSSSNYEEFCQTNGYKDRNRNNEDPPLNGFSTRNMASESFRSNIYFNTKMDRNVSDNVGYNSRRYTKSSHDSGKYNRNGKYNPTSWRNHNSDRENWSSEKKANSVRYSQKQNLLDRKENQNTGRNVIASSNIAKKGKITIQINSILRSCFYLQFHLNQDENNLNS